MFSSPKHKTNIKMEWVTITPAQAGKVLSHTDATNFPQRPLSQQVAQKYSQEMLAGTWHSHTADVIRLCMHEGAYAALDGQHRLKAIEKSGSAQDMWVAFDVPENAFKYVDQGAVRSLGHVMTSAGWPSPAILASAGRMIYCNEHGLPPVFNKGVAIASGTMFDWIADNHSGLCDIQEVYGKVIRKAAKRCHVVEAIMLFLFYHWEKQSHDAAVQTIAFYADSYESEPPYKVYRLALSKLDENAVFFRAQKDQGAAVRSEMQRYQQGMILRYAWECAVNEAGNPKTVTGFKKNFNAWLKARIEEERSWDL